MTKKIRIENADTASLKVVVQVWEKARYDDQPDQLVSEKPLNHPTDQLEEYLHGTRYIVIKEAHLGTQTEPPK